MTTAWDGCAPLLDAALALVEEGSRVLLSTNSTLCDDGALEDLARAGLRAAGRRGRIHREPPLPDFAPGQGAVTLWITLG